MLVLGGPGSGKSSIVAKIADETCQRATLKEIPGYHTCFTSVLSHLSHD